MNASRRCSHCGQMGHNARTCPDTSRVKLFGVNLSSDAETGLMRCASAENLVPTPMSQNSSELSGRGRVDVTGYRTSPLGGSRPSLKEEGQFATFRPTDRVGSSDSGGEEPALASARGRSGQAAAAVQATPLPHGSEEQEGRSEDFAPERGSQNDDDVDGTRMLQTDEKMLSAEGDGYLSDNGGGPDLTASTSKERKKGVPWTEEEHRLFLLGLSKLGKGDWRGISRNFVHTRTPTQVASHAQKYFIRQNNINKRKRRASLLDISTESLSVDPGMLRSMSTPSLPTLAEDLRVGVTGSSNMAAGVPLSFGQNSGRSGAPGLASPGASPSFGPHSPDVKLSEPKLLEQQHQMQKLPDFPVHSAQGASPAMYNPAMAFPNHLGPYQHDPGSYLSSGFRPPYMDFGRSHSFPVVGAPVSVSEASALTRPSSLPTLGGAMPLGGMEGAWPPAGACDSGSMYWSQVYENSKQRAPDAQALASMDPAMRHRLGHEMMMEMMGRQLNHRVAADYTRMQGAGCPSDPDLERRAKVPRGPGAVSLMIEAGSARAPGPVNRPSPSPLSAQYPHFGYPGGRTGAMNDSAAAAAAAAAAGAAAAAVAAASPGARGISQHPMLAPPSWYMGSAYNPWMYQYGARYPPTSTTMMQSYSWPALPQPALVPSASTAAAAVSGAAPDDSPRVHRPTAVIPTAPICLPNAGPAISEGTDTKDSDQEPAKALVMLSKGIEALPSDSREHRGTEVERQPLRTLQLFDVSERPSAFHPQQCPVSRLSPEASDASKSPISVP